MGSLRSAGDSQAAASGRSVRSEAPASARSVTHRREPKDAKPGAAVEEPESSEESEEEEEKPAGASAKSD